MPRPALMTFGIELEFVAIIRKTSLIQWNLARGIPAGETELHRNGYIRDYIADILSTHDRDPYNPNHLPPPPPTWENTSLGTVIHVEPKQGNYRYWSVSKEASVGAFTSDILKDFNIRNAPNRIRDFDREFWYDGAELVSSILCLEAGFQWINQIQRVNRLLSNLPPNPRWIPPNVNILCQTPRSAGCGLHVHIGYGPEDIPWPVIQAIYILWGIYEPEIEGLQPVERRSGRNDYALSLRTMCKPFNFKRYATGITRTRNPTELNNLLTPPGKRPRDLKIGISEARGDGVSSGSKRQTLEFRECVGTVNDVHIKWWVKFIEAVVRLAQSIVDIKFDLVGDLYARERGKPGCYLMESVFDHVCLVNLDQEGRDFWEDMRAFFETLRSPSLAGDDEDEVMEM